jgi:hypothetical protein
LLLDRKTRRPARLACRELGEERRIADASVMAL